jgi:hypothetical protein
MTSRGDCPDSLRRTAIGWALNVPPGRSELKHQMIVWCNFSDVFKNRIDFEDQVARRRFYRRQSTPVRLREEQS